MSIKPVFSIPFYFRVVLAGCGGMFTDGYVLGAVSPALPGAIADLHLNSLETGIVAAAPFAGLLLGSLWSGNMIDRFGRRIPFVWDMIVFAILALAHAFVFDTWSLSGLRFMIGLVLGIDYVAGKVYVSEFVPTTLRGVLMSWLSVAWIGGYTVAYGAGYGLHMLFPTYDWKVIFASAAVPALLAVILRTGMPESPVWLASQNRHQEASIITQRYIGKESETPSGIEKRQPKPAWSSLFKNSQKRKTIGVVTFYSLHNVPYLVLNSFLPGILGELGLRDPFASGLLYDALILSGSVAGLLIINRLRRKTIAVGSLLVQASLLLLIVLVSSGPMTSLILLSLFGVVLASADGLTYVYPPECFPTAIRASGIGLTVAVSRLMATICTFSFPLALKIFGLNTVFGALAGILAVGAGLCWHLAPETRDMRIES